MAELRHALLEPQRCLPDDLRDLFGPDGASQALQDLIGKFGKILQAWPDLVEAARRLGQQPRL